MTDKEDWRGEHFIKNVKPHLAGGNGYNVNPRMLAKRLKDQKSKYDPSKGTKTREKGLRNGK